jgi:hypothetical protein
MPLGIPEELEEALLRALDMEAESQRSGPPSAHSLAKRQRLLREVRGALESWHGGRSTIEESVKALNAAVTASRQ